MPIYEFECPIHGIFERYFSLAAFEQIKDGIYCNQRVLVKSADEDPYCNRLSEKAWSLPVYPSYGKPTVVFRNKQTGEVEVATYDHQQAPAGFIREELRTPYERSKFEKEQTQNQRIEDEYKTEERRYAVDFARKKRHDDLNAKMSSITSKADNPAAAESLLKAAMERTRKKKVPEKRSEMRLDVNHQNKSNLDKG